MSDFQASFPIGALRFAIAGLAYDITLYQRGGTFHAAWYCKKCLTRTETGDSPNRAAAQRTAEIAIDSHHLSLQHGR